MPTGRQPRTGLSATASLVLSVLMTLGVLVTPASADGPVFADGFESGSLANWTNVNGLFVQQAEVLSGSWAARGVDGASWAFKDLPGAYGELYVKTDFKVVSHETHVTLLRLGGTSGPPTSQVFLNARGRIVVRNHVTGQNTVSSTSVQPGGWHELQVRLRVGGSARTDVWLDGTLIEDVSGPGNFGSDQIERLEIGNRPQDRVYDVALDDLIADVDPIPSGPVDPVDPEDPGDPSGLPSVFPDNTWHTNGAVRTILRVGNVVYLGGNFTQLRERPVGQSGGAVVSVSNLAALDATTGKPVGYTASAQSTSFNPWVTGGSDVMVHALAFADGKLFVGGRFEAVGGTTQRNLAAVNPTTGSLDAGFRPRLGVVWALDASGNRLYAGGAFSRVNGEARLRLAAFGFGGTLDPLWTPSADARVRDVGVIPGGSGIFVGGHFASVRSASGGPWHERQSVARFTMAGDVDTDWEVNRRISSNNWTIELLPHPPTGQVYVATGGSDFIAAFNINTGNQFWRNDTNGQAQSVVVMGDRIVVGGHYQWIQRDPRTPGCGTHGSEYCENRLRIAALHLNGHLDMDWVPATTGHYNGVWSLALDGPRLWLGGEFLRITGVRQSYIGRLS